MNHHSTVLVDMVYFTVALQVACVLHVLMLVPTHRRLQAVCARVVPLLPIAVVACATMCVSLACGCEYVCSLVKARALPLLLPAVGALAFGLSPESAPSWTALQLACAVVGACTAVACTRARDGLCTWWRASVVPRLERRRELLWEPHSRSARHVRPWGWLAWVAAVACTNLADDGACQLTMFAGTGEWVQCADVLPANAWEPGMLPWPSSAAWWRHRCVQTSRFATGVHRRARLPSPSVTLCLPHPRPHSRCPAAAAALTRVIDVHAIPPAHRFSDGQVCSWPAPACTHPSPRAKARPSLLALVCTATGNMHTARRWNVRNHTKPLRVQDQIFVKGLDGRTVPVNVTLQDYVTRASIRIHMATGVPPDHQRLIFQGRQLDPGKTLAQYRVRAASTLHMVGRLRGGVHKGHAGPTPKAGAQPRPQQAAGARGWCVVRQSLVFSKGTHTRACACTHAHT